VFTTTTGFCESRVSPDSIFGLLHRECFRLFPDEMFADLFADSGRNCVPPMIVAVVMVLQWIDGCSDREAVDRFCFDARWKYAAGGLSFDYPSFVHTVLVDMRARLAASERPDRIFEVVLDAATKAGLVGRRRVLDSTSLYDAVATMDTVTLIRSAIRGLLGACDRVLEDELRGLLSVVMITRPRGNRSAITRTAKRARSSSTRSRKTPVRCWGRWTAGSSRLGCRRQRRRWLPLSARILTRARMACSGSRRVAKDRIISTVDPDARHGHKTSARGFDGYKGHVAVDPDSELICATTVTAGNVGDGQAVEALLASELAVPDASDPPEDESPAGPEESLAVYGDSAYGAGSVLDTLEQADAEIMCKVQPPVAPGGRYAKDTFGIDLAAGTVTCPAGQTAPLRAIKKRAHRPLRRRVPVMPAG
jgi:hypothetical protein